MEQLHTSRVLSSFFAFLLLNSLFIEKKKRTYGNASFINYLVIEGENTHAHTKHCFENQTNSCCELRPVWWRPFKRVQGGMEVVCAETSICTCCPLSLPGNLAADVAAVSCLWSGSLSCPPTAVESNCIRSPICASGKFGSAAVSTPLLPLEFQASRQRERDQNGPAALNYLGWQSAAAAASRCRDNLLARTWPPNPRLPGPAARIKDSARPQPRAGSPPAPAAALIRLALTSASASRTLGRAELSLGAPRPLCPSTASTANGPGRTRKPHLRDSGQAASVLWSRVCLLDWALRRRNLQETVPT